MKTLLALLLLIPSLSWGKSEWKLSSLNLTQVIVQEVEIVHVDMTKIGITRYHLRGDTQFYICNLYYMSNKPHKSECFYEDW